MKALKQFEKDQDNTNMTFNTTLPLKDLELMDSQTLFTKQLFSSQTP